MPLNEALVEVMVLPNPSPNLLFLLALLRKSAWLENEDSCTIALRGCVCYGGSPWQMYGDVQESKAMCN